MKRSKRKRTRQVNRAIRFIETSCSKDSIILMVSNKMFKIKRTTLICRLLKSSQLDLTAKRALKDLSLRILSSYKNWSQCGRRHSVLRKLLWNKLMMPAKSKMKRSARYRGANARSIYIEEFERKAAWECEHVSNTIVSTRHDQIWRAYIRHQNASIA